MTAYVFVAHPDDAMLGCGGTIARYVHLKKPVKLIAFTSGDFSPINDPKLHTEQKLAEFEKAAKELGLKQATCLGLDDFKLAKELEREEIKERIIKILKKDKPHAVYTHCIDAPEKSHRLVARFVKKVLEELNVKYELYTFSYWLRFRHREYPRLNIDTSKTYKQKAKAVQAFASQRPLIDICYWIVRIRDMLAGFKLGYKSAESFTSW